VIVVVGGQARKAGKTRAMCDIIAATRDVRWTAVKISPHEHHATGAGDTQRYLGAGAAAACLITPGEPLPAAANLIVESNAVMETLRPDLFVFVADDDRSEWKDSARRVFPLADIVVQGRITPEVLRRIRETLSGSPPSAPAGFPPSRPE
jgi:hypothetical protein